MIMKENTIFISYRRVPCVEFARTIHYALAKFEIDSFFDYTSCRDGHFNEKIFEAIDNCKYFFLIMMDGSLDSMFENPNDWVRMELEYAFDKGKVIIPIVKNGHSRNWPDKLPDKLKGLRTLQISKVDDEELFEVSLKEVLRCRTTLLNERSTMNMVSNSANVRSSKPQMSTFIAIGYNLTHFAVRYLRGQSNASDLDGIRTAVRGVRIPLPSIEQLTADTMIEYFNKCIKSVSGMFGDEAANAVDFGIIYHLSDIARRSNIGRDFAHSYDKSLMIAGRKIHLPEEFMEKILASDGNTMMNYYDEAKAYANRSHY